jgi:hypothetical protein
MFGQKLNVHRILFSTGGTYTDLIMSGEFFTQPLSSVASDKAKY